MEPYRPEQRGATRPLWILDIVHKIASFADNHEAILAAAKSTVTREEFIRGIIEQYAQRSKTSVVAMGIGLVESGFRAPEECFPQKFRDIIYLETQNVRGKTAYNQSVVGSIRPYWDKGSREILVPCDGYHITASVKFGPVESGKNDNCESWLGCVHNPDGPQP